MKSLSFDQLKKFPEEDFENFDVAETRAALTIYKRNIDEQSILIVVQAFFPTWKFPTYFSFDGVGKIFADGIIANKNGKKENASDEYLFQFR